MGSGRNQLGGGGFVLEEGDLGDRASGGKVEGWSSPLAPGFRS